MGLVGGVQDLGPAGLDSCGLAVVDVGGGVQAEAAVTVLVVVPAEEWARAASIVGNRAGNAGRYLRVLNWASEYGLSLL